MCAGAQSYITRRPLKNKLVKSLSVNCVKIIVSVTFKQFIQYQTDATRKAAEIIEKSKVRIRLNMINLLNILRLKKN